MIALASILSWMFSLTFIFKSTNTDAAVGWAGSGIYSTLLFLNLIGEKE